MCINAAQNGGFETFFADRYYEEGNELYDHIRRTSDYKTARRIVTHWLKKVDQK